MVFFVCRLPVVRRASRVGPHELFHMAVLVGIGFHWQFVFQFASGAVAVPERDGAQGK